jgi:hypothetical protein
LSAISIAGNTSGTVTLQAPAVAGTTTLNLPTISGGTLVTSDSSSNVPIGNNTTATGTGAIEKFQVIGAGAGITGGPSASAQFRFSSTQNSIYQRFYNSRNDAVNGHTALQNNDSIYTNNTYGSDGTTWRSATAIQCSVDGAVSSGIVPGRIEFYTSNSSGVNNVVGYFRANGDFQFNSGYGSAAVAYGCRAWVNFNGTTGAIRASGNVTSVTRNGTGDYSINFTNAFPDANYVGQGTSIQNGAGNGPTCAQKSGSTATTTVFPAYLTNDAGAAQDSTVIMWAFHR